MKQEIHGYAEVNDSDLEEYKKSFQFVEKEGKTLFPFYKLKTSLTDSVNILIKQKRKYTKKTK